MDAGEWASCVQAMLEAGGEQRMATTWRVCAAVAASLEAYRPRLFRGPESWCDDRQAWINGLLRQQHDIESIRGLAASMPDVFGAYRSAVMDHESAEAGRLSVLLWTIDTLRSIVESGLNVPAKLIDGVGDVIAYDWRIESIPFGGDLRTLATTSTRRYDILPKAWRYA